MTDPMDDPKLLSLWAETLTREPPAAVLSACARPWTFAAARVSGR